MLKIKKILVPIDFSEVALPVVEMALTLAMPFDAKIFLMHVVHEPADTAGFYFPHVSSLDKLHEEMKEGARKMMRKFVREAMGTFENYEVVLESGLPFKKIIKFAKNRGIDLIIMGSVGRTGLDRALFGSTVDKVIKTTDVPVLTVKRSKT